MPNFPLFGPLSPLIPLNFTSKILDFPLQISNLVTAAGFPIPSPPSAHMLVPWFASVYASCYSPKLLLSPPFDEIRCPRPLFSTAARHYRKSMSAATLVSCPGPPVEVIVTRHYSLSSSATQWELSRGTVDARFDHPAP